MNNTKERALLEKLIQDPRITDDRWIAYIMATTKHETNNTFEPIEEAYWLSDSWRSNNLRYYPWHGRGYVQITWKNNYERMSARLGIPELATNPELAFDPDIAYEILVVGMIEGLFTGKDLDDYLTDDYTDYRRARRIVNGMDKADLIADYAKMYEDLIWKVSDEMEALDEVDEVDEDQIELVFLESVGCFSTIKKKGMKDSPCIFFLQNLLNKIFFGRRKLTADGIFGPKTEKAVKAFQKRFALLPDGVVGKKTWNVLNNLSGW